MTSCRYRISLCIMFLAITASVPASEYRSSERFERNIRAFEVSDQETPPPSNGIVAVGSSSIRRWNQMIEDDLHPLTIIPRGFGGSNMNDTLNFADRIVLPYKPRAILLYQGDNDISQGIAPQQIVDTFHAFTRHIHDQLPTCRIYVISIKPSIRRWNLWPEMEETNRLLSKACEADPRLTFINVATSMMNEEGAPIPELFEDDELHINRAGYKRWREIIRPVLLNAEFSFEEAALLEGTIDSTP